MMEMMSWSATISPCAKGSKLFESFDMDFYNEKCAEYDALPQTEKGKYKSRDAYDHMLFHLLVCKYYSIQPPLELK